MKHFPIRATLVALAWFSLVCNAPAAEREDGWISLFDGKSLEGWKASEHKESCRVEEGLLLLGGERSHLFYNGPVEDHDFKDFELKAEVKTKPGSNSGIFFHTEYQEEGWPEVGHEAQVNQTHGDWRKTGSVYAVKDVRESAAKDDEWFDYHIIVHGNKVTLKINGETVNEYTEDPEGPMVADRPKRKLGHGTIALQAHDPGSLVYYRNIRIKPHSGDDDKPADDSHGAIQQPKSCCPVVCCRVARRRWR